MYLSDGFRSVIRIAGFVVGGNAGTLCLKVKELQPPKIDGRGMIDTTTMLNQFYETQAPKYLVKMGEITLQCNWDPGAYLTIANNILNRTLLYTIVFPDNTTLTIWAAMNEFTPASLREGEFPLAEVKITPTMRDGSVGAEAGFSMTTVNEGVSFWPPVPRPVGP